MDDLKFASELVINGTNVKEVPCLVGEDDPEEKEIAGKDGSLYLHNKTGIIWCKNNGQYIRPNIVNGPSANSIMQRGCVVHEREAPYAVALGESEVHGSHAYAEGWATKSTGVSSHAEGNNNSATANDAHVGGRILEQIIRTPLCMELDVCQVHQVK